QHAAEEFQPARNHACRKGEESFTCRLRVYWGRTYFDDRMSQRLACPHGQLEAGRSIRIRGIAETIVAIDADPKRPSVGPKLIKRRHVLMVVLSLRRLKPSEAVAY